MSDAVHVGFARSQLLKKEWDGLKVEIQALGHGEKDDLERRAAIQVRMNQITSEMAAVLAQTKKAVPTPDIDDDDDDDGHSHANSMVNGNTASEKSGEGRGLCQSPLIQYSAHSLHIVQRTYDSTDSEDEHSLPECPPLPVLVLDADELQPQLPEERESSPDDEELRRSMMADCTSTDTVITVEGRPHSERGFRAGLGGLGHLIKDMLKDMHSPTWSSQAQLTEEEREQLTLEQSRLEREARKLKRISERSRQEQRRLEEVSSRIGKISNKLRGSSAQSSPGAAKGGGSSSSAAGSSTPLQAVSPASNGISPLPDVRNSSFYASSPTATINTHKENMTSPNNRIKARKSVLFRHANNAPTQEEEDMSLDAADATSPSRAAAAAEAAVAAKESVSAKSSSSKRKKGWMSLEAGVASLKAFGKTMRGGSPAKAEAGKSHGSPDRSSRVEQGGNEFAEAAQRVAKRGEQLNATVQGSEQMANDANEMLDAVRALRERNQKGGFFS